MHGGGNGAGDESVLQTAAAGGTRGAATAGTGVLAKLAGVGSAGKLAMACLTGGTAVGTCLVAGVSPLPGFGPERGTKARAPERVAVGHASGPAAPAGNAAVRDRGGGADRTDGS